MGYTLIDHTADIGIEVEEEDMEKAFQTSAKAMFDIIAGKENITPREEKKIRCSADDPEQLLVDFLSELLYIYEVERFMVAATLVKIKQAEEQDGEWRLMATLAGEDYDMEVHEIEMEIKAVTYHMLKVEGGKLSVLFDI